jgi:hypothetical protein
MILQYAVLHNNKGINIVIYVMMYTVTNAVTFSAINKHKKYAEMEIS